MWGGIACLGLVTTVLLVLSSLKNIEVTEYGLNQSRLTETVDPNAYGAGRHLIGPLNFFVKFPAMLRTIQFSDAKLQSDLPEGERGDGLLRSRTRDGLDVLIELSFQYQLKRDKLYDLYTLLGPNPGYHRVFVRIAVDLLTETATLFSATEYFVKRNEIGSKMEQHLKDVFAKKLFCSVNSFQLRSVQLPKAFEEAIQQTEVMKQDVKVAQAEQNATRVSLETRLMQAQRGTNATKSQGEAQAAAVTLQNKADIAQYLAGQKKSAESYAGVLHELDDSPKNMLAYIRTRVLREHPSDRTMLGLGPSGPEAK